jgi:hypothetical protein
MIERLLASLIVLAMLVLVFFIVFPNTETRNAGGDLPPKEEERIGPGGGKRQTPPEVAPKDAGKPDAPDGERPAPDEKRADKPSIVPDPGAPKPEAPDEDTARPAPDDGSPSRDAPSSKTVKGPEKEQDKIAEQKIPRPVPERDKKGDKEKVSYAKNGDQAREAEPRYSRRYPKREREAEPHYSDRYPKREREAGRDDEGGVYVRQTQYRERWRRNHYYECEGGSCDCTCDRPYWSRNGPVCWEEPNW